MTVEVDAQPFIDGIIYGEGPRWHHGRLWFSDIHAGKVYSAGESGDLATEVEIDKPSGLGWLPDGTLVVSTLFEAKVHRYLPGADRPDTLDVGHLAAMTNDLVVTPDGRIYVDLYGLAGDRKGGIGLLGPGGELQVVASGLLIPNGLGVSPDGKTLVVNEFRRSRILAYPVLSDGTLGAPGVFADLGGGHHPDGLCVDADGAVWVGTCYTREFLRVTSGGTVTHRVSIDRGWAVAPALGGPDGRTLYMIVDDTTQEGLVSGDSTGWILQARVDVPGAGSP